MRMQLLMLDILMRNTNKVRLRRHLPSDRANCSSILFVFFGNEQCIHCIEMNAFFQSLIIPKMNNLSLILFLFIYQLLVIKVECKLTKIQSECELEALQTGTSLSDRYNSLDENTEWDTRIHHDYLAKYLGFAGWIQMGLWKNTKLTAFRKSAPELHQV